MGLHFASSHFVIELAGVPNPSDCHLLVPLVTEGRAGLDPS